jgi:PTH1 family peptidyl-tRNA hydrolase
LELEYGWIMTWYDKARCFYQKIFAVQDGSKKEDYQVKYLIVGLGNIGAEYENTRHNIGFDILDKIATQEHVLFKNDQFGAIAEFKHKGRTIYLLKPTTYMNLSGKAVRYWVQKLKIPDNNWLIVVDEFQFDIGVYKLLKKGTSGGHNGLKSIEEVMQSSIYPRLRIGIGHDFRPGQQVNYVLGKWSPDQWDAMQPVIDDVCDLIRSFTAIGLDRTMNFYNKRKPSDKKL